MNLLLVFSLWPKTRMILYRPLWSGTYSISTPIPTSIWSFLLFFPIPVTTPYSLLNSSYRRPLFFDTTANITNLLNKWETNNLMKALGWVGWSKSQHTSKKSKRKHWKSNPNQAQTIPVRIVRRVHPHLLTSISERDRTKWIDLKTHIVRLVTYQFRNGGRKSVDKWLVQNISR